MIDTACGSSVNPVIETFWTPVSVDVLTVANTLINAYEIEVPIAITGKFRLGDIRHNYADLTKINSVLGFEPKVFFEEGIAHFTKWVLSQKIEKDLLSESLAEMKKKGVPVPQDPNSTKNSDTPQVQ